MAVKTRPTSREANDVGRNKKDGNPAEGGDERGRTPIGKQVNVRIPPDLLSDLQFVADDASLDISAVIRMILSQNVEVYVRQIRDRKQRQEGE
jgi:hypothetical protein